MSCPSTRTETKTVADALADYELSIHDSSENDSSHDSQYHLLSKRIMELPNCLAEFRQLKYSIEEENSDVTLDNEIELH